MKPVRGVFVRQQSIVRVVVGEATEPTHGPLRFVLEGEGFDVVGQGSTPAELEGVLARVHPDVVVLGADVSAAAVLTVRRKAPLARIIVAWPAGVSGGIADEQIEPSRIYEELGRAVRRQALRHVLRVPDAQPREDTIIVVPEAEAEAEPEPAPAPAQVPGRRSARALVGTASVISLVILMIGAAFALKGVKQQGPGADGRGSRQPVSTATHFRSPTAGAPHGGARAGCAASAHANQGSGRGRGAERTRAGTRRHASTCGSQGRDRSDSGKGKGKGNGKGKSAAAHGRGRAGGSDHPDASSNGAGRAGAPGAGSVDRSSGTGSTSHATGRASPSGHA